MHCNRNNDNIQEVMFFFYKNDCISVFKLYNTLKMNRLNY